MITEIGKSDWLPSPNCNFAFKDDSGTWWRVIQAWLEFKEKHWNSGFWTLKKQWTIWKCWVSAFLARLIRFFAWSVRCFAWVFMNSGLKFKAKLEIPRFQNQYNSGNTMLHEPLQSWQDMSFAILNYIVVWSGFYQTGKGCGKHRDGQVVLEFFPGLSLTSYQIQLEIQAYRPDNFKIAWDHLQTEISVWDLQRSVLLPQAEIMSCWSS